MENPALWMVDMHSGLVVHVSDRAGYTNPPRSLVGERTFQCLSENTPEQTPVPGSKPSFFPAKVWHKNGTIRRGFTA